MAEAAAEVGTLVNLDSDLNLKTPKNWPIYSDFINIDKRLCEKYTATILHQVSILHAAYKDS